MYYKAFFVDGQNNETVLDAGLMSTVEAPVRVRAVIINVLAHEGNVIEGWIGTRRVLEIYDFCLDTQEATATDLGPFSTVKIGRLPVDLEIPKGMAFKIGINSGGTSSDIYGAYEYEELGA